MKIADVKKLSPLERFLYWIRERYNIYLRRKLGRPKPWTDDEILQRHFFTMPYREMDKTTVWFRENIRDPLRNQPEVLMATVIFRWFNYIPTGELLWNFGKDQEGVADLLTRWNPEVVLRELGRVREKGGQIFTGAFMINSPGGEPKLESIVRRITNVWNNREKLIDEDTYWESMQELHSALKTFEGLGGFMAYEIVCDLRYTYLLEHAPDKMTWCNPGPGCSRGLHRIKGLDWKSKGNNATSPPLPKDWKAEMQNLLLVVRNRLGGSMPVFEMREIEHSLCEFDKYCRALEGDGRLKRTYNGLAERTKK